ncbi:hypothetical protein BJX61DRAFT_542857 [Aspergillus egyptiacus]|nr:hypothetical protein BJX61DRAFT_542857 [Aspergillus egyptiacus]
MEEPPSSHTDQGHRKLRIACDACHNAKTRCSGGEPCEKCDRGCVPPLSLSLSLPSPPLPEISHRQTYYTARLGKPKGARNKRTLERLAANEGRSSSSAIKSPRMEPADELASPAWIDPPTATTSPMASWPLCDPSLHAFGDALPDGFVDLDPASICPPPPNEGLYQVGCVPGGSLKSTRVHGMLMAESLDQSSLVDALGGDGDMAPSTDHQGPPLASLVSTPVPPNVREETSENRYQASLGGRGPAEATVHKSMPVPYNTTGPPVASNPASSNDSSEQPPCSCLRRLTDQLSLLSLTERQHRSLSSDCILSHASAILTTSNAVLSCPLCRLDPTTLSIHPLPCTDQRRGP